MVQSKEEPRKIGERFMANNSKFLAELNGGSKKKR